MEFMIKLPSMSYVELHACSAFSFLRGASFPEQLAETAADLEMPAMALLDRNGVYGAQRFSVAAREQNIRPIVGCELSMADGSVLPLLVKNRTGYKNLCDADAGAPRSVKDAVSFAGMNSGITEAPGPSGSARDSRASLRLLAAKIWENAGDTSRVRSRMSRNARSSIDVSVATMSRRNPAPFPAR